MRKDLIDSSIATLIASYGSVRMPVDDEPLERMFATRDLVGIAATVKRVLRVSARVFLTVAKSDSEGPPRAPAWVTKPDPVPLFGSSAFKQTIVTVYVRRSFVTRVGFESVVVAMAHEMCHVILDSTRNPLRKSEEAVDLTAMLLGFRDFYVTGCRQIQQQSWGSYAEHYGYLSQEEITYAARAMTFR